MKISKAQTQTLNFLAKHGPQALTLSSQIPAEALAKKGLVTSTRDGAYVTLYAITDAGRAAL